MERITQDMRFRQSLMRYAERYGVARASRRYDKAPSYIYFWRKRWDGSIESLREKSRRPHHHPNEHTETELKLIRNMRRRNPKLGVVELWHRLRKRGYTPSRLLAIPGVAPSRHAPGGEGKEKVRRQTVPADDASWRAYCVIVSWFRSQSLSSRYSCLC